MAVAVGERRSLSSFGDAASASPGFAEARLPPRGKCEALARLRDKLNPIVVVVNNCGFGTAADAGRTLQRCSDGRRHGLVTSAATRSPRRPLPTRKRDDKGLRSGGR